MGLLKKLLNPKTFFGKKGLNPLKTLKGGKKPKKPVLGAKPLPNLAKPLRDMTKPGYSPRDEMMNRPMAKPINRPQLGMPGSDFGGKPGRRGVRPVGRGRRPDL